MTANQIGLWVLGIMGSLTISGIFFMVRRNVSTTDKIEKEQKSQGEQIVAIRVKLEASHGKSEQHIKNSDIRYQEQRKKIHDLSTRIIGNEFEIRGVKKDIKRIEQEC